jgi:hypothetical protein
VSTNILEKYTAPSFTVEVIQVGKVAVYMEMRGKEDGTGQANWKPKTLKRGATPEQEE